MKQIKDVAILKDAITEERKYMTIGERSGSDIVESIIDSLAVEVPEAKPGAIDKALIQLLYEFEHIDKNPILEWQKEMVNSARAELAQLQADNVALKKTVDEIASLNEKMNDEAIKLQADLKFEEAENKNPKGALRTLANQLVENEIVPPAYDPEYENKSWVDCWIAYALANPTEEVEG